MIQYLRGDIGAPPGGFPEPLRSKVLKYYNLYLVEGCPRSKLGDYNFDKAAEELWSKYGFPGISYKYVIVDWEDWEAVYGKVSHNLPTNILLNPMR